MVYGCNGWGLQMVLMGCRENVVGQSVWMIPIVLMVTRWQGGIQNYSPLGLLCWMSFPVNKNNRDSKFKNI